MGFVDISTLPPDRAQALSALEPLPWQPTDLWAVPPVIQEKIDEVAAKAADKVAALVWEALGSQKAHAQDGDGIDWSEIDQNLPHACRPGERGPDDDVFDAIQGMFALFGVPTSLMAAKSARDYYLASRLTAAELQLARDAMEAAGDRFTMFKNWPSTGNLRNLRGTALMAVLVAASLLVAWIYAKSSVNPQCGSGNAVNQEPTIKVD